MTKRFRCLLGLIAVGAMGCDPASSDVCPAGLQQCGQACFDLAADPANCGACGVQCPGGACTAGQCTTGVGGTGGSGGAPTGGTGAAPTGGASTGGAPTGGSGGTVNFLTCDSTDVTPALTRSTCAQYGGIAATRGGVPFLVLNNAWNGTNNTQCIDVLGPAFTVTSQTGSQSHSSGPVSYPSILLGYKDASTRTLDGILPRQVSSITSCRTNWTQNAGTVAGTYNASYDVWFNTGATPSGSAPTGAYLMVWPYRGAGIQPVGRATTTVSIGGINWDVWPGTVGGVPIVSYVDSAGATQTTLDLKLFMNDAVSRGILQSSYYLSAISAGFEIWDGGAGLRSIDYCVDVI